MERRLHNIEIRTDSNSNSNNASDNSKSVTISGYALLFNTLSKDLGGFKETIKANALDNVDFSKVYMLFNHDYDKPLANVESKTLDLNVDDKGLAFTATLDSSVSYVSDVINQIQNGNIKSCSFGFDVDNSDDNADTFTEDHDGNVIRTINKIKDLFDVSLVTVPAYDETTVKVDKRSYNQFLNTKKENKGDNKIMKYSKVENPEQKTQKLETRSFVDYVRTHGEKRDGLTTINMNAVIPDSIMKNIKDLNANKLNLKNMVDVRNVPTGHGTLPLVDNQAVALSKEELAENPDLQNEIKLVKYDTTTYAGKIMLSDELVDDSTDLNIKQELVKDMANIANNTYNSKIASAANGISATQVSDLDGLRKEILSIDPRFKKQILMDSTLYAQIRNTKNNNGDYILKDDTLLGLPITVTNLVTGAVIGDLESAIVLFDRNNTTVNWQQFDSYSQGLALALRFDVKLVAQQAIKHVTMATGK